MSVKSGIYKIENVINGKIYIGSATSLMKRLGQHKNQLRQQKHPNIKLQRSWNKYGEAAFVFAPVEMVVDKSLLIAREQHWLDSEQPYYNIAKVAGSNLGVVASEASRKKASTALKGRPKTPEARANMRIAAQNRTPEHRAKISASLLGKVVSAATREKMSANRIGKKATPETLKRMSASNKGRVKTAEERANISAALTGKSLPPDVRAKISAAQIGRVISAATRAKTSASLIGRKKSPESIAKRLVTVAANRAANLQQAASCV